MLWRINIASLHCHHSTPNRMTLEKVHQVLQDAVMAEVNGRPFPSVVSDNPVAVPCGEGRLYLSPSPGGDLIATYSARRLVTATSQPSGGLCRWLAPYAKGYDPSIPVLQADDIWFSPGVAAVYRAHLGMREPMHTAFLRSLAYSETRVYRCNRQNTGWLIIDGRGLAWLVQQRGTLLGVTGVSNRALPVHAYRSNQFRLTTHASRRSYSRFGQSEAAALVESRIVHTLKTQTVLFNADFGRVSYVSVGGETLVLFPTPAEVAIVTRYSTQDVTAEWYSAQLERCRGVTCLYSGAVPTGTQG